MAARAPHMITAQPAGSAPGRLERVSRMGARRVLRPKLPWMLVLPALLVAAAMLTPVVYLIIRTSEAGNDVWSLILRERTAVIFWNTLKLAAGVSGAAIAIAVPYAWLTTRTDLPVRRLWESLAPLPLVIPSYAGTLAINAKGAAHGEIGQTQFLPKNVLKYGVDGDGNGRIDMVRSKADALASTANFLRGHGWRAGGGYQPGESNYGAIQGWNAAKVYQQAIAIMGAQIDGVSQ